MHPSGLIFTIMQFSNYIVYADESGDHSLVSINPQNPVFVLAFCIFEKRVYMETVVPMVQRLKFDFFGHDCLVLHSHEIRKARGEFSILLNANIRTAFVERVNAIMRDAPMTIIAAAIDKQRHVRQYSDPANPYGIALTFCMERLQRWLVERGQANSKTHVLVEMRGKSEDAKLELEFRRISDGHNHVGPMSNLEIRFMDKKHNSTGLQVADLVAHPIGRHVINPTQPNRAYDLIEPKFRRNSAGHIRGYGLKIFP
ncbi:DUF3800 domain-containing protein [Methylocystis echinoides]|uniref:DUF3800 domain-containing protein n=1 Tax=Methylocystis echinoides TaxID=29468 RepID=UPI00342492E4